MFGIFGKKKDPSTVPDKERSSPSTADEKPLSKSDDKSYQGAGFDPTGLERAAKAAKALESSRFAKDAIKLTHLQEQTKQLEYQTRVEEYQTHQRQMALQQISKEAEEARRTLEAQTEHDRLRAQYRDQLERKRQVDELNAKKYTLEEELRKQEELVKRQEAIKRKTLEYEAELRQQTELARVKAETEGRIRQERENHDLRLEQTRVEAEEYRSTILEAIALAGQTVGNGIKDFLSDKEKMTAGVVTLSAVALGVYSAKTSTAVAGRYIEAHLGKPSLVRETSRQTVLGTLKNPASFFKKVFSQHKPHDALEGVILEPHLDERLRSIALSTFNTKKNKAPFRHLLLHGPPGTGKTLFAKGLAKHSGLEYAILTGGDVAPLGRDAVTELHKLFDWANTNRKGLLLFVDEADAFLRKRSTEHISEDVRNALNAFLYRTGESTDKFMLVYASNQPDQFDWAINDRIDEMVEFTLPGLEERRRMLNYYLKKYLIDRDGASQRARQVNIVGIKDDHLEDAARATENFSGREISKLAIAWQAAAYGNEKAEFTPSIMKSVLQIHCEQNTRKNNG